MSRPRLTSPNRLPWRDVATITTSLDQATVDEAGSEDSDANLVSSSDSDSNASDAVTKEGDGKAKRSNEKEPRSKERIQRLDQIYSKASVLCTICS